jgi:hypothetical protein
VVADGPAIYGMFRIVSRSRRGAKGAGYGWLLVGCGTLASIGGNVAHANDDLVAQAIAAAIPLAVLAMLEGLKGDAGEVTHLAARAADLHRTGALDQPNQLPHPTTVRRTTIANPDTPSAALDVHQRALPAGPRSDPTTVGARLQAAHAQPRPDGQAWTARTLAEAAGCGRSSAASFLQRQRPPAAEPVSRPSWQLRDAAVGYASHGIPVLPLHYPLPHHRDLQALTGDHQLPSPVVRRSCSCRDPGCGQVGKHPLGSLVPHGVKDATCNRARILAWWSRHPQANIGLATGHRFDVLDVDGPQGEQTIRTLAAEHGLQSFGPLVRTGGGGWHFYLAPTGLGNVCPAGLAHVDWRGRGGYVVAPPSRHPSGHPYQWAPGRDLDIPPGQVPAVLLERLQPRQRQRPTGPAQLPAASDRLGDRYARAALAEELARVATAPVGQRNRQLWESTRNLYNLVATGDLDPREVDQGLLQAAERCGLLTEEPRQTRRTLASGRQVGLAHPGRPRQPAHPERTHPSPPARAAGERTKEGR